MLAPLIGSILLLFGGVIIGYTLYSMLVNNPKTYVLWIPDSLPSFNVCQYCWWPSSVVNLYGKNNKWSLIY